MNMDYAAIDLTEGKTTYHSLTSVAARIGLPDSEVKKMANAGVIPFIKVGKKRRFFNTCEVLDAVNRLARAQQKRQATEWLKESKNVTKES